MSVFAELHDGRKLEFPDGTDPAVIQRTVKRVLSEKRGKTAQDFRNENPAEYDPASPEFQAKFGPGERTRDPLGQQIAGRLQAAAGGLATGGAFFAGIPADTGQNLINLGLTGYGAARNLLTGRKDSPPVMRGSLGTSENLLEGIRAIGGEPANLSPEDPASRLLHRTGVIGGASAGSPLRAVVPAIAGGNLAAETLGEEFTALGTIAPTTANAGIRALRANSRANAAAGAKVFTDVGAQPSAGLSTGGSFFNGLENLIAKFPGGAKVMETFKSRLQADIGKRATTGVSPEKAGSTIEQGITGPKGFLARTGAKFQQLDDGLAKSMGGTVVIPNNTTKLLQELTTPVAGAERSTGGLVNPKINKLMDDINADLAANPNGLPYEALRRIRTDVGGMLKDTLISDVPSAQLERLYGALSDDLGVAAGAAGKGQAFARQNQFWTARQNRVKDVLDKVIGKGRHPEDIFKAIDPKDPDASSKLTATLRSLEPAERRVVSDAVINKLGRERPSGQNAEGNLFSTNVFLTNWNKISPKAKSMLFPDARYRNNLDQIAKAADTLKASGSAFEQTSGAVGSFAAAGIYSAPFFSLVTLATTGSVAKAGVPLAVAGATAGTAFTGAKLLTSPKFVSWLTSGPKGPPPAVANHFARLGAMYNGSDDEEFKAELEAYINEANK